MTKDYELYLNIMQKKYFDKYFEQQKEYMFCKQKCSKCCEFGEYPFSGLEFKYAMIGYEGLNDEKKALVKEKIKKVKALQADWKDGEFMYECPFLLDKMCSIYEHRGMICRTHGLMFYYIDENGEEKNKAPNCMCSGLNYSQVYDENTKTISNEMMKKSGIETEPVAYNLSLKFLLNNELTKKMELDFGEEKALIDWFD